MTALFICFVIFSVLLSDAYVPLIQGCAWLPTILSAYILAH